MLCTVELYPFLWMLLNVRKRQANDVHTQPKAKMNVHVNVHVNVIVNANANVNQNMYVNMNVNTNVNMNVNGHSRPPYLGVIFSCSLVGVWSLVAVSASPAGWHAVVTAPFSVEAAPSIFMRAGIPKNGF